MSFNIIPVASGYQEIHPYSAINIDSVKINTSLIMMKECTLHYSYSLSLELGMLDLTSKPYVDITNIQNMLKDENVDNCIFRFEFSELLSLQACNVIQDIGQASDWPEQ